MLANSEAQRLQNQRQIFTQIPNQIHDAFSFHLALVEDNKKNKRAYHESLPLMMKQLSLDSVVSTDLEIGEKSQVSKSNIGRCVKIGDRSKIVNCVILNGVTIGNDVQIQNSLILSKAFIGNGSKIKEAKISMG